MTLSTRPGYVHILDQLRGLAALSVVWHHFSKTGNFGESDFLAYWLKLSGQFGRSGVEVFFVISGFVLPFAMSRANYRLGNFWRFIYKRLVRLEPAYLASIGLVLAISFLTPLLPGSRAHPYELDLGRLFSHLAYLCSFLNYDWYNVVYWTLAIELQFYVSVALLFPMLVHKRPLIRAATLCILLVVSLFAQQKHMLPKYLPLFVMGICAFKLYVSLLNYRGWVFFTVIAGLFSLLTIGLVATTAGLIASFVIVLSREFGLSSVENRPIWRFFGWVGTWSYSLYLIHIPVGITVISMGSRFLPGALGHVLTLGVACIFSFVAAWLMHRFIEKPSQEWSSRINV